MQVPLDVKSTSVGINTEWLFFKAKHLGISSKRRLASYPLKLLLRKKSPPARLLQASVKTRLSSAWNAQAAWVEQAETEMTAAFWAALLLATVRQYFE